MGDFGSARLVKGERISQEALQGVGPLDLTAPLLGADYRVSSGVEMQCWCAPEIVGKDIEHQLMYRDTILEKLCCIVVNQYF